jgi:hypothetical protein
MAQPKSSKSVPASWALEFPETFGRVLRKMFKLNLISFFEELQSLLEKFDKIEFLISDKVFLEKLKTGSFVFNDLFWGILTSRLFRFKKYIPLYLDGMKLNSTHLPSVVSAEEFRKRIDPVDLEPMSESHFFAVWHMLTIDPKSDFISTIAPIERHRKYYLSFQMGEGSFISTVHVIFELRDSCWHYSASHDFPKRMDVYLYLTK